jgi:hypothetical protein
MGRWALDALPHQTEASDGGGVPKARRSLGKAFAHPTSRRPSDQPSANPSRSARSVPALMSRPPPGLSACRCQPGFRRFLTPAVPGKWTDRDRACGWQRPPPGRPRGVVSADEPRLTHGRGHARIARAACRLAALAGARRAHVPHRRPLQRPLVGRGRSAVSCRIVRSASGVRRDGLSS